MKTRDENSATLQDVARLADEGRSFFLLGWCTGRCDTVPPRSLMDAEAQRRVASRLTTDDRDIEDWLRGYQAGAAGSKTALAIAIEEAEAQKEFRVGDPVEWQDSGGRWRPGEIVHAGEFPRVRLRRANGNEDTVEMSRRAIRRRP